MTCIVGLLDDGDIYIGGDSAGVGGYALHVRADQKVFRNGPFLMGFTTSFRMGQLLRYKLTPPEHPYIAGTGKRMDTYKYMVTHFVDAVRQCLKDGGYASKDKEVEEGGTFLVGYDGRLFEIESDYQVAEQAVEFHAVGCGDQIALGSLYSSRGRPPKERVVMALEAAERFSPYVRGPFVIEKLAKGVSA
jgi:ATP-dependent protease HslVU (ClpYQ) peptidase subunit